MNKWNITRQSQFNLPIFLLVGGRFQVIVTIDAYLSERFQNISSFDKFSFVCGAGYYCSGKLRLRLKSTFFVPLRDRPFDSLDPKSAILIT